MAENTENPTNQAKNTVGISSQSSQYNQSTGQPGAQNGPKYDDFGFQVNFDPSKDYLSCDPSKLSPKDRDDLIRFLETKALKPHYVIAAKEYLQSGKYANAAVAGKSKSKSYSAKTISGKRWLNRPEVVLYLRAIEERNIYNYETSPDGIRASLLKIAKDGEVRSADCIRAYELLGKMHGIFRDSTITNNVIQGGQSDDLRSFLRTRVDVSSKEPSNNLKGDVEVVASSSK